MQKEIRRELIRLALPLIASNILQQLYQAVDALILARYVGADAFAASGVASAPLNLLFAIVGLCGGFSVLFARYYGAGDESAFRRQHFHSLALGLCLSGFLCLATISFQGPLLLLLKTPEELREGVGVYLLLVAGALPASFLYNLYATILRSAGRTKECLHILLVSLLANVFLDYLLVAVLSMGIAGAAFATALCQLLSAVLAMATVWKKERRLFFTKKERSLNLAVLKMTLSFGLIGGLHQASLYIGKLFVQGAINSLGTEAILAFTAAGRLEGFANSIGDSGACATSIVVAQAYGAGDKGKIRETFRVSLLLLALLGSVLGLLLFFASPAALPLLIDGQRTRALLLATRYLRLIAPFYVLCFTGNTFAGYFDGVQKVTITFIGALSHITLRAILTNLFIQRGGLSSVALFTGLGWLLVNLFWESVRRFHGSCHGAPVSLARKSRGASI